MSRSSPCESKTKTKQSFCEWSRFAARNTEDGRLGMLLIFCHPIYLVQRSTRSARPFDCDTRPCRSQAQETFPPADWHPDSCHHVCSSLEDSICPLWHRSKKVSSLTCIGMKVFVVDNNSWTPSFVRHTVLIDISKAKFLRLQRTT